MKYFNPDDFACRCGCGTNEMKVETMERLDRLREEAGFPLIVNSGFRCKQHNREVSDTGDFGPHTTGHAVDIRVDRERAYRVLGLAGKHGFTGIGIQQKGGGRFLHLDDLPNDIGQPRPTVWSY